MRGRSHPALATLALAALALLLPLAAAAQSGPPPNTHTECNHAGLALSEIGATRQHVYTDGHGHTVELWCIRRVFTANYDLRFIRNNQSATIAGCYFNKAQNLGPTLHLAPSGAYTSVEWLNQSLTSTGTSHHFAYNIATNQITVTTTATCRPPVITVLPPHADFEKLERLLPPRTDCPAEG